MSSMSMIHHSLPCCGGFMHSFAGRQAGGESNTHAGNRQTGDRQTGDRRTWCVAVLVRAHGLHQDHRDALLDLD